MKRAAALLLWIYGIAMAQTQPTPLRSNFIPGITSSATIIENRSQATRANDSHTFCAVGTGTWSAQIQYQDGGTLGAWTNFSNSGSLVTNASPICTGIGVGYHDYIRFSIAGAVSVSYAGTRYIYFPAVGAGTGGGISGPGSSVNGYVPQWNGGGGNALSGGLPITTLAPMANALAETNVSGLISQGIGGTGVSNTASLTLGTSNQNYSTLGTGIVFNTTITGALRNAIASDIISLWTGTCSNVTVLYGDGHCGAATTGVTSITFQTPLTATTVTGTGTIGCIPCVTSASPLTNNQLVLGNGAQGAQVIGTYGSAATVLHGSSVSGPPSFSALSLATDVTGLLGNSFGGTGRDSSLWTGVLHVTSGAWAAGPVSLSSTDVGGTLLINNGGTGASTLSAAGIPVFGGANVFTNTNLFPSIDLKGSSTGYHRLVSANTGATNYTITVPNPSGSSDTFCLQTLANCGGGSTSFGSITSGTNTTPLLIGAGGSLGTTGGGTIAATSVPAAGVAAGALANGMAATTQSPGDHTSKIATTAFVPNGPNSGTVITNILTCPTGTNTLTTFTLGSIGSSPTYFGPSGCTSGQTISFTFTPSAAITFTWPSGFGAVPVSFQSGHSYYITGTWDGTTPLYNISPPIDLTGPGLIPTTTAPTYSSGINPPAANEIPYCDSGTNICGQLGPDGIVRGNVKQGTGLAIGNGASDFTYITPGTGVSGALARAVSGSTGNICLTDGSCGSSIFTPSTLQGYDDFCLFSSTLSSPGAFTAKHPYLFSGNNTGETAALLLPACGLQLTTPATTGWSSFIYLSNFAYPNPATNITKILIVFSTGSATVGNFAFSLGNDNTVLSGGTANGISIQALAGASNITLETCVSGTCTSTSSGVAYAANTVYKATMTTTGSGQACIQVTQGATVGSTVCATAPSVAPAANSAQVGFVATSSATATGKLFYWAYQIPGY